MKFYSNKFSHEAAEPTWLAVFETVLVAFLVLWGIQRTQQFWLFLAWASIGWAYMLRTQLSTEYACKLFGGIHKLCNGVIVLGETISSKLHTKLMEKIEKRTTENYNFYFIACMLLVFLPSVISYLFGMIAILLGAMVAKLYGVAVATINSPLESITSIPKNWFKSVLCTDMRTPLEIVPGYEATLRATAYPVENPGNPDDHVRVYLLSKRFNMALPFGAQGFYGTIFKIVSTNWWLLLVLLPGVFFGHSISWRYAAVSILLLAALLLMPFTPVRVLVYVPALFYRLALKVTTLAYFPLLLNGYSVVSSIPIEQKYKEIRESKRTVVSLRLAWFALAVLIIKIIIYSFGNFLTDDSNPFFGRVAERIGSAPFLGRVIAPLSIKNYLVIQLSVYRIPIWQIAAALGGICTLAFHYFVVEFFYWRMDRKEVVDVWLMQLLLNTLLITAGTISTYSILANIWIVTHRTPFIVLPKIGPIWP
jgi:hypothetical protein